MKTKYYPLDLSYFRLLLLDFLRESHPELPDDSQFVNARVEAALDAYSQSVQGGSNALEAEHSANEVLFAGLHFSKYDTLKNILWNEFFDQLPEEDAPELAKRFLPECESVFAKYRLSDDFAYSPEYELLYTELTGTVAIIMKNEELGMKNL